MNPQKDERPRAAAGRRGPRKAGSKVPKRTSAETTRSGGRSTSKPDVPIVGVGASAGGLQALEELLGAVPANSGLAFLVVQHLDPAHDSQLAPVLAAHTALRVVEAAEGQAVEPDTVYTIPPGRFMGLQEGRLRLVPQTQEQIPRMSVDFLFRSLAEDLHEKAICVVLSGSGSDGTLGLRAVRGAGGLAVVQEPVTAQYDSMPRSAIATGLVDLVLPPVAIAPTILSYVRHAYSRAVVEGESAGVVAEGLDEILRLLLRANADFRGYKPGTLLRRVHRRMGVNQVATLAEYAQLLRAQPDEVAKLAKDILIAVTAFFRDPMAYEALRKLAIAPLVKALPEDQRVRVWVAGCSTGEEAYSIAILALEQLESAYKTNRLQVFASDLDEEALAFARAGIYPESIAADVSPERLARFFTRRDHGYQVSRELRDMIVFSAHNLVADPPFTRMDVVSCRNVLIYLGAGLQQMLISRLSLALNAGGYLFLGPAEGLGDNVDTFESVSKKWRIYRRTPAPRHDIVDFPIAPKAPAPAAVLPARSVALRVNVAALAQRALLEHFAAALVLIDSKGNILYVQGDTDKYLRLASGGADLNLFAMARERLPRRLRAAVRQALATNEPLRIEHAPVTADGGAIVNVMVKPVGDQRAQERLLAVIFEDLQQADTVQGAVPAAGDLADAGAAVQQLEAELRTAREELLLTATEHAAASEELRAAHEEAISMNEELRSTNEELETSKEELQSVNEELATLNAELQDKIRALNEVNSDLANLLVATEIATVFLDRDLCVRRFTPSATQLLNLMPSDVGRPVSHLSQRFRNGEMAQQAEQVLRDLTPVQSEVQTPEGHWYLMRVLPYRDVNDRTEGVVVTFVDVTPLRQAQLYAESIVATVRGPLLVLDRELRVVSANPAFYRVFEVRPEETEGRRLPEVGEKQWDIPELREQLAAVVSEGAGIEEFEVEREFPGIGRRTIALSARRIEEGPGHPALILLAMEDVTARTRARQMVEAMVAEVSHRTKNGLAIVASLLQLQVDREQMDEVSSGLIRDTIARIRAFATLNEQVQRGQTDRIELVSALRQIAETVRAAIPTERAAIAVEGEPAWYPFRASTNLVVLANELITNALKHGAADAAGVHQIKVRTGTEEGKLVLSVWNSGNPIPEDFDPSATKTTGLYLVRTMVGNYYDGEFRLEADAGGTRATVVLPEERLRQDL